MPTSPASTMRRSRFRTTSNGVSLSMLRSSVSPTFQLCPAPAELAYRPGTAFPLFWHVRVSPARAVTRRQGGGVIVELEDHGKSYVLHGHLLTYLVLEALRLDLANITDRGRNRPVLFLDRDGHALGWQIGGHEP